MSDAPTDVPGVALRRIRHRTYVVVFPRRLGNANIGWLARYLHLQPEEAFEAILRYRSNTRAVRALYRDHIQHIDARFPGLAQARRELRSAGQAVRAISADGQSGRIYVTGLAFESWSIYLEENQAVVLPLSQGFRTVMRDATARRRRQARVRAVTPDFTALETELRRIRDVSRSLDMDIGLFRSLTEQSARDIAMLEALDGMVNVLLRFPQSAPSSSDRTDLQFLQRQLRTLINQAYQDMMMNPPDSLRQNLVSNRNRRSATLMRLIENTTFVRHVRTLVNNRDIAPAELWTRTADTLRQAASVLLLSPQADAFIDRHVLPLINLLASRPFDTQGLRAPNYPAFQQAVINAPAAPSGSNSALVIFGGLAGTATLTVGNLPGPASLSVAVLELSAPPLMGRIVESTLRVEQGSTYAGRMYRALTTIAGLSRAERVALIEAIDQGDVGALRRVNWSNKFMNSPAWGSALAVASAICLFVAIRADDVSTLRYWSNILGSASGTAIGVSVALQRYSTLLRNGIVRGIGGKVLGVVGGLAAVVSGTVTAVEEYRTSDRVGMGIAIAGAAGGALTVAGFLVATGAGASATGVGATVGVIFMALGIILGIGAGIVALIRQLTTAGSHLIFEAFINHFGIQYEYTRAITARAALRQAFETVQRVHHGVDFWDGAADKIPELHDLGFGVAHIAQITDQEESLVRRRLRAAGRTL